MGNFLFNNIQPRLIFTSATPFLLVIVLCGLLLREGISATADLQAPHDPDLYRDIAHAQAILDGFWWDDPVYLGEKRWYNPLVPALIAGLARLTQLPVLSLYTQAGAYLNLLAPLCFFWLTAVLWDKWTGLLCATAYIFMITGHQKSWNTSSYSPWLFSQNFTQSFFFLSLTCFYFACVRNQLRWYLLTGVLAGVIFLGHTAPVIILAGIIGPVIGLRLLKAWKTRATGASIRALTVGVVCSAVIALLVSLPFLATIIGHYRLRVLNTQPQSWQEPLLDLSSHQFGLLLRHLIETFAPLGLLGLADLVVRREWWLQKQIVILWLLLTAGFIGLSYFLQVKNLNYSANFFLPVPSFHFLFYFSAAQAALLGLAIRGLVKFFVERYLLRANKAGNTSLFKLSRLAAPQLEMLVIVGLVAIIVISYYPGYYRRRDFEEARHTARLILQEQADLAASRWILSNTQPTDVFLTSETAGHYIVGAAGRKVVVEEVYFSNPYVDSLPYII